jgi:hypothetical protein
VKDRGGKRPPATDEPAAWNAGASGCVYCSLSELEKNAMKSILTVVALSFAAAVSAPAFAQTTSTPSTQAECEKMADKRWDDQSKTCLPK